MDNKKIDIKPILIGGMYKLPFREEVGNAVSHGVPAILLFLFLPLISIMGYNRGDYKLGLGYGVYISCLFLMFSFSTLYHSMDFHSKHKQVFRILDHSMIFLAIAGSFTPICLQLENQWLGIGILVCQWLMVIFGILYKSLAKKRMPKASLAIYLIMGWSAVLLLPSFIQGRQWGLLAFILAGGILYSVGAYFYSKKDKIWHHFIWHIFIVLASIAHLIGILFLS